MNTMINNSSLLIDKHLKALYFEERKTVALSDGTILTCDFDAQKIPQIRDYITTEKSLNKGALFGKPTLVRRVAKAEIEHYLNQPSLQSFGNQSVSLNDSEPSIRLHEYLQSSVDKGCSDIHFEVYEDKTVIYCRVDGRRVWLGEIPDPSYGEQLFSYIFTAKATEKDNDYVAKDANNGHVSEMLMCKEIIVELGETISRKIKRMTSWRVAYLPTKRGGRCTFRWLDAYSKIPTLEELDWTQGHVNALRNYLNTPSGVCIISGKTGSGKTTVIASALSEIPTDRSVVTLEEPPEFDLKQIIQVHVKPTTPVKEGGNEMRGFGYYSKQTLRHDVDVEMHGEVRDHNGAMELARKGETGQLMFTSLHTSSATGIAHTLTEQMNVPSPVIAAPDLMRLWIYQTLIRKLCTECSFTADEAAQYYKEKPDNKVLSWLKHIDQLCDGDIDAVRFRNPQGCPHCFEGEKGRTTAVEMIVIDDQDREYIIKKDYLGWQKALKAKGFKDVRDHAISKIKAGIIDVVTASTKINNLLPISSAEIYKTFEM
ncbi:GspE/PulE family protein [Shewanella frigidimarina]|uniref:GspE/PulE family protein n=1 Tax=Shewanella frigidimarina TaxID=56812 RepID=UPI003D7A9D42